MGVELEYYMAKTLDQLIQKSNLALAWKRIQSNPSPNYKNYFRKLYANYAIGETTLLSDLHDRLKRGVYRPAHSCKDLSSQSIWWTPTHHSAHSRRPDRLPTFHERDRRKIRPNHEQIS